MPINPKTPYNATTNSNKIVTRANSSTLPSNSDIMAALETIHDEFLSANKNLSTTQTSQFKELKSDLKHLANN